MNCTKIDEAIAAFALEAGANGRLVSKTPYGNGHINDTFLVCCQTTESTEKRYILQRMNHDIFKNPPQLMENMVHVTEHLRKKILAQGGDPERETLNIMKTESGADWYQAGLDWAAANGISDGANPEALVTREQLAAMLYRFAGSPAVSGGVTAFGDNAAVSGYALDAVRWAVEKGILTGYEDGSLQPGGKATRAQLAVMLMRYITVQ